MGLTLERVQELKRERAFQTEVNGTNKGKTENYEPRINKRGSGLAGAGVHLGRSDKWHSRDNC